MPHLHIFVAQFLSTSHMGSLFLALQFPLYNCKSWHSFLLQQKSLAFSLNVLMDHKSTSRTLLWYQLGHMKCQRTQYKHEKKKLYFILLTFLLVLTLFIDQKHSHAQCMQNPGLKTKNGDEV